MCNIRRKGEPPDIEVIENVSARNVEVNPGDVPEALIFRPSYDEFKDIRNYMTWMETQVGW